MRKSLVLILIILGQNCNSQNHDADSLLKEFRTQIQINQGENSGDVWWDDELRKTYYLLMDIAPTDTLIKYTSDTNAAVRCSMFNGLAHTNIDISKLKEISDAHVNDTAGFMQFFTDVGIYWTVKEYMEMLVGLKSENKLQERDYKSLIAGIKPFPLAFIEGLQNYKITRDELLKVDSLKCSVKEYRVVSFTLITVKNSRLNEKNSPNGAFTSAMKRTIRKLRPGDKIYIENIKAALQDGTRRTLSPINIKII